MDIASETESNDTKKKSPESETKVKDDVENNKGQTTKEE